MNTLSSAQNACTGLLLYCRPGFETECATETTALLQNQGISGNIQATPNTGYVVFDGTAEQHNHYFQNQIHEISWRDFTFARQCICWFAHLQDLPSRDRLTPIVQATLTHNLVFGRVWGETADTNESKTSAGFLKRFLPLFENELQANRRLKDDAARPTLHLFLPSAEEAYLGLSWPQTAHAWPMGIPRLRMPTDAPSRSTLKLAEAFMVLLDEDEYRTSLRAGLWAADLGAAPGGWSYQLASRGIHVFAVDNGNLAPSLRKNGMVEHVRADGFTWRPPRKLEWMVCDMVEQPARIAQLVAEWIATGRCRRSIFNLKLPMKKRWQELERCQQIIAKRLKAVGGEHTLRIKHLYHDREEVTAYLAKIK